MKYKLPRPITTGFFNIPFTGDKHFEATAIGSLDSADEETIIFYSRLDASVLKTLTAGIIIADERLKEEVAEHHVAKAIVYTEKPKYIFMKLLEVLFSNSFEDEVMPYKKPVKIAKNSYVESEVSIGEGSEVYPLAAIYNPTVVGKNCRIQSGSVIGGIGLGDLWHNNTYNNFVHLGAVIIEDDVTVGVNVNISRGMLENTVIGTGTRIANNVSIGHSVIIGRNCYISAGVTVGGACIIEDNCWLAVGVTLTDHVKVGKNTMIGTGGVLVKDALENSLYFGNPARKVSERK